MLCQGNLRWFLKKPFSTGEPLRFQYWPNQATPDPTLFMAFGVAILKVHTNSQDFRLSFSQIETN